MPVSPNERAVGRENVRFIPNSVSCLNASPGLARSRVSCSTSGWASDAAPTAVSRSVGSRRYSLSLTPGMRTSEKPTPDRPL